MIYMYLLVNMWLLASTLKAASETCNKSIIVRFPQDVEDGQRAGAAELPQA